MKEEWRLIQNFPWYEISNFGRFRRSEHWIVSKRGKVIIHKPYIHKETNSKGDYLRIVLRNFDGRKRSISIHRLVWEQFVGRIPNGFHIHHIDGNKQNNRLVNLKLLSSKEHHIEHFLENPSITSGMTYYNKYVRPKKICQYTLDGKFLSEYNNSKEASDATGVCQRNILQVCNKTEYIKGHYRKQAGGYIWKFDNETIHN